jgi:hypothetical protein
VLKISGRKETASKKGEKNDCGKIKENGEFPSIET